MAADDGGTDQSHKAHRSRQSGASAKKKKRGKSDKKSRDIPDNEKKQNPRVGYFIHNTIAPPPFKFSSLRFLLDFPVS